MDKGFDVNQFVTRIGKRLVEQFADARSATSPSTVATAMEQPVREQLEQILPRGIGVGSGFVIDSNGGTSRQMDVILYEKDICPVFSINKTAETTYYPCEGVIAAGEVKSRLDRGLLEDCFAKIGSVRKLRRHLVRHRIPDPNTGELYVMDRAYGALHDDSLRDIAKGKARIAATQIFGFIVAGTLRMSPDTLCKAFVELNGDSEDRLSPSLLAVLDGGVATWARLRKGRPQVVKQESGGKYVLRDPVGEDVSWEPTWSAQDAEFVTYSDEADAFRILISWVYNVYRTGRTSDVRAFDQYFKAAHNSLGAPKILATKEGIPLEALLHRMGLTQT